MSLRIKFTLALVLTSVVSSLVVGGVAEWILWRSFRETVMKEAFGHFQSDVIAYVHQYGTWEKGIQREDFHDFVIRRRNDTGLRDDPSPVAEITTRSKRDSDIIDRSENPPFRFLLLDAGGTVLRPITPYSPGEKVGRHIVTQSYPIRSNDRIIAYAFPVGEPRLTDRDQAYFQAIREALIAGVVIASLFSILTGLIFGRRLSLSLTRLIHSLSQFGEVIEDSDADLNLESFKISEGVTPGSKDELGRLAHTFNVMIERSISAHNRLKDESTRDPLTNLYNRRHFNRQASILFDLARRGHEPMCVMLGDIDFFKKINDTYSHAVGDEVLKKIAEILLENTRKYDLPARHGGEEFIVLFPRSKINDALPVCERIRQVIEDYSWKDIHDGLQVTMSMGISDSMDLGSVGRMTEEADKYLYQAKANGRNRIEYPGKKGKFAGSFFKRLIRTKILRTHK